jgi:hypothetical protein
MIRPSPAPAYLLACPQAEPDIAIQTRSDRSPFCAVIGGFVRPVRTRRLQCREKSWSGAPRPMKTGTIVSPWRYEAATPKRVSIADSAMPYDLAPCQIGGFLRYFSGWSGYPSVNPGINVMCASALFRRCVQPGPNAFSAPVAGDGAWSWVDSRSALALRTASAPRINSAYRVSR